MPTSILHLHIIPVSIKLSVLPMMTILVNYSANKKLFGCPFIIKTVVALIFWLVLPLFVIISILHQRLIYTFMIKFCFFFGEKNWQPVSVY